MTWKTTEHKNVFKQLYARTTERSDNCRVRLDFHITRGCRDNMFSQKGLQKHRVQEWTEREVFRWLKQKGLGKLWRHFRGMLDSCDLQFRFVKSSWLLWSNHIIAQDSKFQFPLFSFKIIKLMEKFYFKRQVKIWVSKDHLQIFLRFASQLIYPIQSKYRLERDKSLQV